MTEAAATILPLTPETGCEEAFGQLLLDCCAAIDRQLAVFFETEDESGPHKARVALRRLTTALDAFAPILRRNEAARVRAAAKRLFRALGEIRDADVFLAAQRGDRDALERKTLELRRKTRKALRDSKAVGFAPGLLRLYASGDLLKRNRRSQIVRAAPVAVLARLVLDDAWRVLLRHGDDPATMTEEARHDFRKDLKTLRYLAEFFAEFWPDAGRAAFRSQMQVLQDELGLLNDLANARARGGEGDPAAEARALKQTARLWAAFAAQPPFWAPPAPPASDEGGQGPDG